MRPTLISLTLLFAFSASTAGPAQDRCTYVIKKGDTLSHILIRLGMRPIYGPAGSVATLAKQNSDRVRDKGDLIFPNVRLSIPRERVGRSEECIDGEEEKDVARRIALYSEAEKQMQQGKYSDLCQKIVIASQAEVAPDRKGRLLHFAAICEYEDGKLEAAYHNWERVLALKPEPSLLYRVNYNLALIECQTSEASKGYERLRGIAPELWQSQNPYARRNFLDLAAYCSEKGSGVPAKLNMLAEVYLASQEPELREYSAHKLQAEFSEAAQCEVSQPVVERLDKSERRERDFRKIWNQACHARSPSYAQMNLGLGLSSLTYVTGGFPLSWIGTTFTAGWGVRRESGWALSATFDSFLQTLSRSGSSLNIRATRLDISGEKAFALRGSTQWGTGLAVSHSSFLSIDRTVGYFDLIALGLRLFWESKRFDQGWFRLAATAGVTNSDSLLIDPSSWFVDTRFENGPGFLRPLYWGVNARYAALRLAGDTPRFTQVGVHLGAAW